jgi:hypothetical protein
MDKEDFGVVMICLTIMVVFFFLGYFCHAEVNLEECKKSSLDNIAEEIRGLQQQKVNVLQDYGVNIMAREPKEE